ncbi:MAG: putative transcriptional regulator [Phenylobacterium sp.]|nr:putative transcriptional regulator [Phenylobacterium sp.]
MPLDAGGLSDLHGETGQTPDPSRVENYAPTLHSGTDIGQALKAIREFRGLSREALAETTRIRAAYLAAIEELQLDKLPSRPFVIGYIRAYAQALGADPDVAAERFKAEEPVLDEPLPEPVGLQNDGDPRLAAIIAAAVVIVVAIVAWNVLQRVMTDTAPAPATASDTSSEKALANTKAGPVALGAPLPAPVESTTPPPYETPGLSKAVNADGVPLSPPSVAAAPPELNLAAAFTPHGQIYGASSGPVVLQALKPAFLVVHGSDGSVYFARQLAEGEAYRTPAIGGLTVDVSEPEAFQVFVSGQSKGVLPRPLTDISGLLGATSAPKAAAAKPATSAASAVKPAASAPKPAAAAKPKADTAKADPPF